MSPNTLLKLSSLSKLSPSQLSEFVKLLISHEVQPGGPYDFGLKNNDRINQKIYHLLDTTKEHRKNTVPKINESWTSIDDLAQDFFQDDTETYKKFVYIYSYLIKTDSLGEISQLSSIFYDSLQPHIRQKISKNNNFINNISLLDKANTYIWTAYSIFDKILDEKMYTELLPFANQLNYEALFLYQECAAMTPKLTSTQSALSSLFLRIHTANSREAKRRRSLRTLKEDLANRSIIHCIGPVIICSMACLYPHEVEKIVTALSNYCAARQLLDDLHDWREDIEKNRMTYVIAQIIRNTKIKDSDNLLVLLSSLSQQFFHETAQNLLRETFDIAQDARRTLEETVLVKHSQFVLNFISPLIKASEKGMQSQAFSRDFLIAYSNTSPNS